MTQKKQKTVFTLSLDDGTVIDGSIMEHADGNHVQINSSRLQFCLSQVEATRLAGEICKLACEL